MAEMPKIIVCYRCKNIQVLRLTSIEQHCDKCGRLLGLITIIFKDKHHIKKLIKKEVV